MALGYTAVAEPRQLRWSSPCRILEGTPVVTVNAMVAMGRVRRKCGGGAIRSTWRCFGRHDRQSPSAPTLHSLRRGLLFVEIDARGNEDAWRAGGRGQQSCDVFMVCQPAPDQKSTDCLRKPLSRRLVRPYAIHEEALSIFQLLGNMLSRHNNARDTTWNTGSAL